ncbi:MAG: hypothetical protein QNJ46_30400 [Leptolyngbyaceae cyanobacterium MO_188.B28]|nr:hypothetical protein [Leptolyngbyaceae cyanobacterium MO_188.B28]
MKYLSYFFIGIIIVIIIAFSMGRQLAALWLVVVLSCLGAVMIALSVLTWFKKHNSLQAAFSELTQTQAAQEIRNQTLEQLLAESQEKLAEQEKYSQTLERSLAESQEKLAEQEKRRQTLERSLAESQEKLTKLEEQEDYPQILEQCRRDLDDAQVGINHALSVLVSYQKAIQPIPGNHRGDYFVEKARIKRIQDMSIRALSCWLRVIQNKDNENSRILRERLGGKSVSTIDLSTFGTVICDLIGCEKA